MPNVKREKLLEKPSWFIRDPVGGGRCRRAEKEDVTPCVVPQQLLVNSCFNYGTLLLLLQMS